MQTSLAVSTRLIEKKKKKKESQGEKALDPTVGILASGLGGRSIARLLPKFHHSIVDFDPPSGIHWMAVSLSCNRSHCFQP